MSIDPSPAGVILCGGESRRMGQPKAWLPFGPERLLQRVARRMAEVAAPLVVVAAPGQELPDLPPGVIVARDPVRGQGPLQGLAAGLAALPVDTVLAFATATDVPFLEPGWITRLLHLIGDHDLALPDCEGYLHPLAALYRVQPAVAAVESLLRSGRLRPVYLKDMLCTRIITAEELRMVDADLASLRNVNTPEDYAAALAEAGFPAPAAPAANSCESPPPGIVIELYGVPRLRAGLGRTVVRAGTVAAALRALGQSCPGLVGSVLSPQGTLEPSYLVNLNGDQFSPDPGWPLVDGDCLLVMAVDAGG